MKLINQLEGLLKDISLWEEKDIMVESIQERLNKSVEAYSSQVEGVCDFYKSLPEKEIIKTFRKRKLW